MVACGDNTNGTNAMSKTVRNTRNPASSPRRTARPAVVFITAHPDDVAFACGGAAWLLKDRYRLHVLCASKGERGYRRQRGRRGGPTPPSAAFGAIRAAEEQAACELLGASLTFLGQIDGDIHPDKPVCDTVAGILTTIAPVAVITHGPFEKKDHSATFSIAYQALHLSGRFWETDLCMLHQMDGSYSLHYPCILVDISAVIEQKKALIRCHRSHLDDENAVDRLIEQNRVFGRMTFCEYAEAFVSPFPMVNKRWGRTPECGRILLDL